jgi:hypothetical protein
MDPELHIYKHACIHRLIFDAYVEQVGLVQYDTALVLAASEATLLLALRLLLILIRIDQPCGCV